MRYRELFEDRLNAGSDLFHAIQKAAHAFGSPSKLDGFRAIYPEFDRVVINARNMRFAAMGRAGEFIETPEAETLIKSFGWTVTVLKTQRERAGFNPDQTQRYKDFVEVRLEDAEKGEELFNLPDVLFHVTARENVDSILEHGLEPRTPSRPELHRYPSRIHFATSIEAANKMREYFEKYDLQNGTEHDYVVLKVKTSSVSPIYVDPEFRRGGVYTTKPVASSAIKTS
jgi:hypothetical protein